MSKGTSKADEELVSVVSAGTLEDIYSTEYHKMKKRIMWKFDLHVLPPLALVRIFSRIDTKRMLNSYHFIAMVGEFHRQDKRWKCKVRSKSLIRHIERFRCLRGHRIAGLQTDINLHGNQFNTALAGELFSTLSTDKKTHNPAYSLLHLVCLQSQNRGQG